jgi:dihydrofolate reductase
MLISIIVAVTENRVIGKDNQLLWRLPDDMKRFKQLTMDNPIIMGRKTYESIGKPLPGRTSIVVTRNREYKLDEAIVVNSLQEAILRARELDAQEAYIIGGGELYKQAQSVSDRLYITEIHTTMSGDAYFEIEDPSQWIETERSVHEADDRHKYAFAFVDYIKQKN